MIDTSLDVYITFLVSDVHATFRTGRNTSIGSRAEDTATDAKISLVEGQCAFSTAKKLYMYLCIVITVLF